MTPDEAPEQRWRRTVDRRNRPAKLKVDRLLRDFGYAELDPEVGDAIEARLAGVSLAVAPSLRNAEAGEVVTIYANDSAAPEEVRAAPEPALVDPAPAEEPAVSDVAQMVTYLKQQVLDARAEAERLRTELDRRIAARLDAERESERIIAEQAAALEAQGRQVAELGAALHSTREALAETRDEIRRAVGELQALPQPPVAAEPEPPPLPDDEPVFSDEGEDDAPDSLSGEEWADGREEAEAAALAPAAVPDEPAEAGGYVDEPALGERAEHPEAPAVGRQEPSPDRDEPVLAAPQSPVAAVPEPDFELDERPLQPPPAAEPEAPGLDLDLDLDAPARGSTAAPPAVDEFDMDAPAEAVEPSASGDAGDWQREMPDGRARGRRRTRPSSRNEPPAPAADEERVDDLDAPLPPADEWLPAGLRPQGDDASAPAPEPLTVSAGEPDDGAAGPNDFDDFLYDADELYDPSESPAGSDTPLEAEIEAHWPDEPGAALPPPPPAPPSPFADEPAAQPPALADRPTRGKALRGRGRGGRSRGRWEGTCSICGRLPQVNRRKDLEAAGWDLDDDAAACPQCRGVG